MKADKLINHYDIDFEKLVINQIIRNDKLKEETNNFGNKVIDELNINHFSSEELQYILKIIQKYNEKYSEIPTFKDIGYNIKSNLQIRKANKVLSVLNSVNEITDKPNYQVRESLIIFLNKIHINKAKKALEKAYINGDINEISKSIEFLKEIESKRKDSKITWSKISDVENTLFEEDYRKPYTLNCGDRLDELMGGGLGRGDLIYMCTRKGFGKTTSGSRLISGWVENELNSIHIVFEDRKNQVFHKICASMLGITINDFKRKKYDINDYNRVKELLDQYHRIIRLNGSTTTTYTLRKEVDRLISDGFMPQMGVLDYLKKVKPKHQYESVWMGGGEIMQDLEAMISPTDLNIGLCVLDQVNRSGYNEEFLDSDNTSGDIGKVEQAHAVMYWSGTDEQSREQLGNFHLAHSRFGDDRIKLENIVFDNANVLIDTGDALENFFEKRDKLYYENNNNLITIK